MYTIFLSHAHADLERASAVYRELVALGQTVWMDESPADAESPPGFVGVPAGQPHEDVIAAAIAESATFLICDSAAWRDSDYCQRELAIAMEVGTRVAVLDPPGAEPFALPGLPAVRGTDAALPDLIATLEEHAEVALAHIRLEDARKGHRPYPWWGGLFGDPERLADATLILTAPPDRDIPRTRPELADYAQDVVAAASTGRRRRRRATLTLLAGLTVLATLAAISGVNASRDAAAAAAAERRASSINLARESLAADQPESVELAKRAWDTDRNAESRSAMAVASASRQAYEVSRFPGVSRPYQLLHLSDGRFAVSQGAQLFIGVPDGQPTRIQLQDPIGMSPLFQAGDTLYARLASGNVMTRIRIDGGSQSRSAVPSVSAMAERDATIWLGTGTGMIGTYDPDADRLKVLARVDLPVSGLEVTASEVNVVARDAMLLRFERTADGIRQRSVTDLTRLAAPLPDSEIGVDATRGEPTRVARLASARGYSERTHVDRVITCGATTHVLLSTRWVGFAAMIHVAVDARSRPVLPITTHVGITSVVCTDRGDLVGAGYGRSAPASFRPGQLVPAGLITRADRFAYTAMARTSDGRLAVIDSDGQLSFSARGGAETQTLGTASFLVPIADGLLAQDIDGSLFAIDQHGATTAVGRLKDPLRMALVRSRAALAVGTDTMYLLGPSGIERRWRQPTGVTATSLDFEGRTSLILLPDRIRLIPLDGGTASDVPLPPLDDGDTFSDIALTHGALFASTAGGRVVRLDPVSGAIQATWTPPRLGRILIDVRPTDEAGLVVFSSEGVVRLLNENLAVTATRYAGSRGALLSSNVASGTILTVTGGARLLLLDGRTLEPRQSLDATGSDNAFVSPDGMRIVTATSYARTTTGATRSTLALREQVIASGRLPALKEGERETEATLTSTPACTDCAPQ